MQQVKTLNFLRFSYTDNSAKRITNMHIYEQLLLFMFDFIAGMC
jgi:hypothetical protein